MCDDFQKTRIFLRSFFNDNLPQGAAAVFFFFPSSPESKDSAAPCVWILEKIFFQTGLKF